MWRRPCWTAHRLSVRAAQRRGKACLFPRWRLKDQAPGIQGRSLLQKTPVDTCFHQGMIRDTGDRCYPHVQPQTRVFTFKLWRLKMWNINVYAVLTSSFTSCYRCNYTGSAIKWRKASRFPSTTVPAWQFVIILRKEWEIQKKCGRNLTKEESS